MENDTPPALILSLPIPDRGLGPNSRLHWSRKQALTRAARRLAKLVTLSALQGRPAPALSRYRLRFWHNVKRRRDDDNAAASCKAYRDGIAEALRIDDTDLRMDAAPTLEVDPTNPRLEILLYP